MGELLHKIAVSQRTCYSFEIHGSCSLELHSRQIDRGAKLLKAGLRARLFQTGESDDEGDVILVFPKLFPPLMEGPLYLTCRRSALKVTPADDNNERYFLGYLILFRQGVSERRSCRLSLRPLRNVCIHII